MPSVLLPVHPHARAQKSPVHLLVWHDIVPSKKLVWFDTTVAEFEGQLKHLGQVGAKPISLLALLAYLRDGKPEPPPGAVVLCFDDNTSGIYEEAFPRLQARGWSFAVSVHTKYVGVATGKAHNTWERLREMQTRGKAEIVCQTVTHPADLRTLSEREVHRECFVAKGVIEMQLECPVRFLTYPSGRWDRRVAEVASAVGFQLGLTEDHGSAESSPHLLGLHRWSTHKRWAEALAAVGRSARGGG